MTSHTARIMQGASPLQDKPVAPCTALAKLRAAAAQFRHAWARPQHFERNENLRVFEAMATLVFCAAIVSIGAFYDASTTRWAAQLSPGIVAVFAKITLIGASGYVFFLTGVVGLGAILLRGASYSARVNAALGVLAGRAFYLFVVAALSGIASQLLKHLFGRARPKLMEIVGPMHFDAFSISATFASFPSGHAVTAFAMAFGLAAMAPRLRWPLLALAVLVAASRVIINAHYLSDVFAGAGLGYGTAVLVRRAFATRNIVFRRSGDAIVVRGAGLVRRCLLVGVSK